MAVRHSPPAGQVRIWKAEGPPLPFDVPGEALLCLLGDERPRPVRGYGGWGQSERTGRRARSRFDGTETPAWEIALRLENSAVPTQGGVLRKVRTLEDFAGLGRKAGDRPPPVLKWAANVHRDNDAYPGTRWVCEGLEFGESYANDRGKLVWWKATIVLAVYRDSTLELEPSKGFDRRELHKGEDLRHFAKRLLGDPKRWVDVADLNRDNSRCPKGPKKEAKQDVLLLVPPREPDGKSGKRKRDED